MRVPLCFAVLFSSWGKDSEHLCLKGIKESFILRREN
jgi:hypothetical protein